MTIVFIKVAVIFSMVGVGYIANRTKILPDESNRYLVNLLMDITMKAAAHSATEAVPASCRD